MTIAVTRAPWGRHFSRTRRKLAAAIWVMPGGLQWQPAHAPFAKADRLGQFEAQA
jgi:hypothetical protein